MYQLPKCPWIEWSKSADVNHDDEEHGKALITFDPNTNQLRGDFVELIGGTDFYAADVKYLKREGKISL